jgi:hypothetical protein
MGDAIGAIVEAERGITDECADQKIVELRDNRGERRK